ncbi:hypothetical protein MTO96_025070 [Rhipicephalus appendiculatus]
MFLLPGGLACLSVTLPGKVRVTTTRPVQTRYSGALTTVPVTSVHCYRREQSSTGLPLSRTDIHKVHWNPRECDRLLLLHLLSNRD